MLARTLCAFVLLALAVDAHAQTVWTKPLNTTGVPSPPTTDISFNASSPSVYVAQGTKIYAYNATSSGAGALRWTRDFTPDSPVNFPSPVPLKGGATVIFFTTSTGKLFAINTSNGSNYWTPVDLRRAGHPNDAFLATPAVQLYNYSNAAFKTAVGDDLIFVPTRFATTATANTDDTSGNQVLAVAASTGTVRWRFNGSGNYALDYASEGCPIDYDNNLVYCAFNQPTGTTQNSLYSLHTAVAANAADSAIFNWATNAGPIHTRPTLRGGKVYVATYDGWMRARSATSLGKETWSARVSTSNYIALNPLVETRTSSTYPNSIVVIDSSHAMYYLDDTRGAVPLWSQNGQNVTSMVASAPYSNRLYIGKSDGTIQELRYEDGTATASALVASGTVYDPSIDNELNHNGQDGDHIFVASGGTASTSNGVTTYSGSTLGLFTIPFIAYTGCSNNTCDGEQSGGGGGALTAQCPYNTNCGTYAANPNTQNGTPCIYTNQCSSATQCCASDPYNNVNCVDTTSNADSCGGCGMTCATNQGCVNGTCTACNTSCPASAPHCNSSLNSCTCSTINGDTCTQNIGNQYSCNTQTGSCTCAPICSSCVPYGGASDGCGHVCTATCTNPVYPSCGGSSGGCVCAYATTYTQDSCKSLGAQHYCSGDGTCQCTPLTCAPYGQTSYSNGCGGTIASSCTALQPACSSGGSCVCTKTPSDSCTANKGSQYTCNTSTGACVCTASCPACTNTRVSDGCGKTCPLCNGDCIPYNGTMICDDSGGQM